MRDYRLARPPSSASMAASRSSGDISSPSTGRLAASSSAVTSCRPKMFWSVGMRSSTSSSAGSGSGALGGEQNELEAVGNLLDTVFDGDARHALSLRAFNFGELLI